MKNKLLIYSLFSISLFTSLTTFSHMNDYFQNNPTWQISSACSAPAPCIKNESYNYYSNGDTTFNSLVYKKIYKKGQGSYSWLSPQPNPGCSGAYNFTDSNPSYFIRSEGKKMFLRLPSDPSEYLLYDFNLSIGDTLPISFNNVENDVMVIAIDSIYTPYGYLRRFALAGNTWAQYLFEGIGHSKGLVEPMQVPLECGYNLDCFSLNDTSYYPMIGPTCNLNVGQSEILIASNFNVYPNPANNNLIVDFDDFSNKTLIKIYNMLGEEVLCTKLVAKSVKIDISLLNNGVYILCVNNGTEMKIKKIIKNFNQ